MKQQSEKILLNPDYKPLEKKRMFVVDKADTTYNPLDAKYERIRSYLMSRKQELTVAFEWDEATRIWWVGILHANGMVKGIPPVTKKEERKFANALWEEYVKVLKIEEEIKK